MLNVIFLESSIKKSELQTAACTLVKKTPTWAGVLIAAVK